MACTWIFYNLQAYKNIFAKLLFTKWHDKNLTYIAFRLNKRRDLKYVLDVTVSCYAGFFIFSSCRFNVTMQTLNILMNHISMFRSLAVNGFCLIR